MNKQTQIIELSQYTTPVITEQRNEGWVDFGKKNDYYQFLIDRFQNSATNNAVINNICKLIYGRGITALDASKKPTDYANFLSLVSSDDIKRIISDTKMLGQSAIQVHYNKDRSVKKFLHLPVNLIRSEKCNEDGEILGYYYSDNWQKTREYKPIRYDAFGTSKSEVEILMIQPYSAGMKYYSYVDYQGALDYCMLEEKVSEYLINEVSNSFAPTTIINFNNGQATPEQKRQISEDVTNKLTGSTGKKVIISFNDNPEAKTTIDTIQLQKAADQYQYLSDESRNKILVGHNVTSPLLFGIATSTGFSSNADELKNSAILFDNMVIRPFQELVIEAFDKILAVNNISLKLYFKKLNILDADGEITNQQPIVEETKLSSDIFDFESLGEEINDEWLLVDSRKVDYDLEDELDKEIENLTPKKSFFAKLVSTGTARGNAKSEQDGKIFKTRYRYAGDKPGERGFCVKMSQQNKVYRKEDIVKMSNTDLGDSYTNKDGRVIGWGPNGATTFDRFIWKGGGNCHHYWVRETYLKKSDVNSPLAKKYTAAESRKMGEIAPTNDKRVYQKPIDMPYNGFLPTNKRFN
ncbi:hypothetical protein UFOVP523_3 [uncultured Caudovirales phage]|uniref:Portal protein n=1 Tax=uncultured Caudovirales phage TaxID=2100421 RepID=A0A6J5MNV2_9CAUD|nr:hypothetical protein UFOVP523_3 [uncultured Caudovirales phage]